WAQDTPTGADIVYAQAIGSSWSDEPVRLVDPYETGAVVEDNQDDLAPKVVYGAGSSPLFLWQRMDTATPPDINENPAGYLSHWQIFAQRGYTFRPDDRPLVQISESGSLNYRHHLAET